MAAITEQIRGHIAGLVEKGTVTRYAVAKHIGISETHLNRFLTGERGLSLATLDALSEMFGLEVSVGIQKLPRPTKRGKKPKKKDPEMITATDWRLLAIRAAEDAYTNYFASRRGTYQITEVSTDSGEAICYYNNNPYGRGPQFREHETKLFRKAMKEAGIKELAYGTFPPRGAEDPGYTYAMILDATDEQSDVIHSKMQEAIVATSKLMDGAK